MAMFLNSAVFKQTHPVTLQYDINHNRMPNVTDSRNPIISDLQWALYSAHLPVPEQHQAWLWPNLKSAPLTASQQLQLNAQLIPYHQQRLGRYFEALIQAGLTHHPDWEVTLAGYTIADRQRTLGEIDLVVTHTETRELTHLELALKYYLRVDCPHCGHRCHWVGPSLKDCYEQKLHRLISHQLPMGLHAEVTRQLSRPIRHQSVILKGRLFVPLNTYEDCTVGLNTGFWCSYDQLEKLKDYDACMPLLRSQWLSGPVDCDWQSLSEIKAHQKPTMMLLRSSGNRSTQWAMVVANDWLERAQQCCPGYELSLSPNR